MKHRYSLPTLSLALTLVACGSGGSGSLGETRQATSSADPPALVVQPAVELSAEVPVAGGADTAPTAAAFNGDVYLAIWTSPGSFAASNLFGARFASNGTLLDLGGFRICQGCTYDLGYGNLSPAISATPGGFLIVWEGGWATVSSDGAPTAHQGNIVAPGLADDGAGSYPKILDYPMLACGPTNCLLVWWDGRVLATLLDTNGGQLGDNFLLGESPSQQPAVAWNGSEYLVAWDNSAVRVKPTGEVRDFPPLAVTSYGIVSVASNGDGFVIGGEKQVSAAAAPVTAARVGADGSVLDTPALALGDCGQLAPPQLGGDGTVGHPFTVVAAHAGNYRVAWQHMFQNSASEYQVSLQTSTVSASGAVSGPTDLAVATRMDGIAIAAGPNGYLFTWGGRLAGDGQSTNPYALFLGDSGENVSTLITGGPLVQAEPAVGHSASDYLVAWVEPQAAQVLAARVATDGQVVDATPLLVGSGTGQRSSPSVASDGTDYAVVWDDAANGTDDIFAAHVSSAGVASTAAAIASGSETQTNPGVASNGSGYLAVWQESTGIHGARLAPDTSLVGSLLVAGGRPDNGGTSVAALGSVASNGKDYLVVWVDAGTARTVYAARVDAQGTVLDANGLSLGPIDPGERPRVEWDGSSYLVVWKGAVTAQGSLHAASVSADGSVTSVELASASAA
ncbi:MAG TPA: hypothetical protein VNG33_08895, partial [Polyangiaceae bacterium]|nr:hypothetical protein [Polyangiaceae bacterium]